MSSNKSTQCSCLKTPKISVSSQMLLRFAMDSCGCLTGAYRDMIAHAVLKHMKLLVWNIAFKEWQENKLGLLTKSQKFPDIAK